VRKPIFSIEGPRSTPDASGSTSNTLIPPSAPPDPVAAKHTTRLASGPLVIIALRPARDHPPSTALARVRIANASEPVSGSVIASAPMLLPLTSSGT
jgi:hypothetical protein